MAIDVGDACISREGTPGKGMRTVSAGNPANDTGTIDTVQIYVKFNEGGIEYGSFSADGNDLTSNDDTDGSNLSADSGACRTHTAAGNDFTAFAINAGEYIGVFSDTPNVFRDYSEGTGYWEVGATSIECSGVTHDWQNFDRLSLYGTGVEGNGAVAPTGALYGPLVGPLGGPI